MSEEKSLRDVRLEKLDAMRALGHDPFKVEKFDLSGSAQQLLDTFSDLSPEELQEKTFRFAGRVVSYRLMGKAGFAHLSDGDAKIQAYFRKGDARASLNESGETDEEGARGWELYNLLDIGDHVGVVGRLGLTKTGEKTIFVTEITPLSKSLQTLPLGKQEFQKDSDGNILRDAQGNPIAGESHYGLADVDQRYRHRHLDLICNPEARAMLINRAKITRAVRNYFDSLGYLEVETPLLQLEAGGASATPFTTHYNAYDLDVKLRISLELYLKRLICGDLPKVYELGRVFRNEGVSNRHNPEFTLLEFYEAYVDLETMMERVEGLFKYVAETVDSLQSNTAKVEMNELLPPPVNPAIFGYVSPQVEDHSIELDFSKPWRRVYLLEEIERHTGLTAEELLSLEIAIVAAQAKGVAQKAIDAGGFIDLKKENNLGGFIEKLLEVFVEPTLIQPTFVVGYPIETSPLAKKDPKNPRMTRRFEGYVLGREICNAFSEINDPIDQRERFEQQLAEQAKGTEETHPMDEEFIYALESGMPPTGGCGIGIDRMAMLLTGADVLREVIFFPTMKPI